MNIFWKVCGGVLTALILWLCLSKQAKDHSVILTMAVCAMVITAAITFLEPIMRFLEKLQSIGTLDQSLLSIIFKIVGIGLVAEISALICKDAGNESMGKALQTLTSVIVLWLSIPVFEKLLSLLDKILGTI